uniref:Uncharacterized protein AlNc14C32G2965 n=1 Tax=Albugo laibachii Nc14 TaxID=890382 RepID=F0W815_9STRA|nr:conserved hypothetical protein [Albugo laibachii Nc14]|eukprot:CCA17268.1 conserved hypothetical protein [Albugo laibachii Nc14]
MGLTNFFERKGKIVIFGASCPLGSATIRDLASRYKKQFRIIAAVENTHDDSLLKLKEYYTLQIKHCDFNDVESLRGVVRDAKAVLLIPMMSADGVTFSKRVIDAVEKKNSIRWVVLISSLLTISGGEDTGDHADNQEESSSMQVDSGAFEEIEAYAQRATLRSQSGIRSVSLRIPVIMETLVVGRDEIIYARRFESIFGQDQVIPFITLNDIARVASDVLTKPRSTRFEQVYSLASKESLVTPREIVDAIGREISQDLSYRQISPERMKNAFKRKRISEQIALSLIQFHKLLRQKEKSWQDEMLYTHFEKITGRRMTSAKEWIQSNISSFIRTPQNQLQLFMIGAIDPVFSQTEKFVSRLTRASIVSSNASPDTMSRTAFCALKSLSTTSHKTSTKVDALTHFDPSELDRLLGQLTANDVVLFVPPLHHDIADCEKILQRLFTAIKKTGAWGLVVMSSIYAGCAPNKKMTDLVDMEKLIERSDIPYAIVRVPMFMEFFLTVHRNEADLKENKGSNNNDQDNQSNQKWDAKTLHEPVLSSGEHSAEGRRSLTSGSRTHSRWNLLSWSLESSRQYLISIEDAVKFMVAIAYTFPLHHYSTYSIYTEALTMKEIEGVLQKYASRKYKIDFSEVEAIQAEGTSWEMLYWTEEYTKAFLESSVILSTDPPIPRELSFQDVVSDIAEPETLDRWAKKHSRLYSHTLGYSLHHHRKKHSNFKPHEEYLAKFDGKENKSSKESVQPIQEDPTNLVTY